MSWPDFRSTRRDVGEEFVVEFERKRLHDGGRRELVQLIEWTAQAKGDGAGYDVQSFNADGSTRLKSCHLDATQYRALVQDSSSQP